MDFSFEILKKNYLVSLINHLPGMLYRCKNDTFWTMEVISEGCLNLTGFEAQELIENSTISYMDLIAPQDRQNVDAIVADAISKDIPWKVEYRIITKDGEIKWVWEQGLAIKENNKVIALEGFITDITRSKENELKLSKTLDKKNKELLINVTLLNEYKKAVDKSSIVSKTTKEGIITYVNDEFCRISKYSREELIGSSHSIVRHPDNPKKEFENLWKTILNKKIWKGVIKNKNKDGEEYFVASTIIPILNEKEEINEFMSIRHDVSELIKKEEKIKQQITDPLTKLPNRIKLFEEIKESSNTILALLDINRFKEINDCYGFTIGDKLLIELAKILEKNFKKIASIYRINADKFALLKYNHISNEDFYEKIKNFIENDLCFNMENNPFCIELSSAFSTDKNLYLKAETALEYAKKLNLKTIFYDKCENLKQEHNSNLEWTKKLREGFFEERFDIFIQAIVDNNTNKISKFESLIRYKEPDGTIISPYYFLDIAKKSRLYSKITKIVIEKSCKFFANRSEEFSINFTIEDILNSEVTEFLIDKITEYKVANRLVVEIVESEGIENFSEINRFIENIKRHGCKVAVDDFGTGYSNFEYLMKLNIDFIKIDGSLIKNIDSDKNAQTVCEVIVEFAKKLGIKTIAEFVHNEKVLEQVKKLGITYSQGYLLDEPKSIKEY